MATPLHAVRQYEFSFCRLMCTMVPHFSIVSSWVHMLESSCTAVYCYYWWCTKISELALFLKPNKWFFNFYLGNLVFGNVGKGSFPIHLNCIRHVNKEVQGHGLCGHGLGGPLCKNGSAFTGVYCVFNSIQFRYLVNTLAHKEPDDSINSFWHKVSKRLF